MADRKRNREKPDEDEKPTKEELAVAKFLRFNVQTKEAKLHSMEVQCFCASSAVNALLESKWSKSQNAKEPLFFNRPSCVSFCDRLLQKGLFHRAEQVLRKKEKAGKARSKKVKDTAEKEEDGTGDELRERKAKKDKKGQEKEDAVQDVAQPSEQEEIKQEDAKEEEKKEEKKESKKKKEKPIKLVMTDDQRFLDGQDNIYVWVYDPASPKTLFIGSLIVLGAIALCLFPLWPPVVRYGVYYVSLVAAVFVGVFLSLVVIRFILFCLIWLGSAGQHHFWLLPNLTEDVDVLESFRPLYTHKVVDKQSAKEKDKGKSASKKSKSKSRKKARSSDKEDSDEQDEFEMVHRGDVEEEEEERMGGEEEEAEEEEDYREEDDDDEEENQNDEDEEEEYEDEEEGIEGEEEEEEEVDESKKDK